MLWKPLLILTIKPSFYIVVWSAMIFFLVWIRRSKQMDDYRETNSWSLLTKQEWITEWLSSLGSKARLLSCWVTKQNRYWSTFLRRWVANYLAIKSAAEETECSKLPELIVWLNDFFQTILSKPNFAILQQSSYQQVIPLSMKNQKGALCECHMSTLERLGWLWFRRRTFMCRIQCTNYYSVFCKQFDLNESNIFLLLSLVRLD